MSLEITLNDEELKDLEDKLNKQRSSLPENEVNLIEAILKQANEAKEKEAETKSVAGWFFGWTYRF